MADFSKIPQEMKDRPQWVAFTWPKKEPWDVKKNKLAKSNDPTTWSTFAEALKFYQARQSNGIGGIGYMFAENDPFAGADLDKCRNPETGEIEQWAADIIFELDSYSEFSPSDTGVHIIVEGALPPGRRSIEVCKDLNKRDGKKRKVEMYDRLRFFTMTGELLPGLPPALMRIRPRQRQLENIHRKIFGQEKTAEDQAPPTLELPDADLIAKAKAAKNGEKFARLWAGNWQDYQSKSEATAALLHLLAFWTQKDAARMDQLFRQSGLMRPKFDRSQSGSTWGALEIQKAINRTAETYQEGGKADQGKALLPATITGGFSLTDMGNSARLVALYGQDLRYCHDWGKWLVWDGQRWKIDNTGSIYRLAKDTVRHIYQEAGQATDEDQRKAIAKWAIRSESEKLRGYMVAGAACELAVVPDDLDRDPWLLNVRNGTLDLKTGKLRSHKRKDFITKLAPVEFDPEAEAPTWWKFLNRICGKNLNVMTFLQKAVGYALTGSVQEQVFFILWGSGDNGKSTFLTCVKTLLGDYAKTTSSETFLSKKFGNIPNDLAALRGARLVTSIETGLGRRMAESLVKEATGGDPIPARFMRAEWFSFIPEFKLFLATNHQPEIRDNTHAMWRRVRLIPFTVQIPREERIKNLPEILKEELSGILNWALGGCILWQDTDLEPPEEVVQATQEYREDMDLLGDWLSDCCIITPGASALARDLYKSYCKWAEENGEKNPLKQKAFGRSLREKGFDKGRTTGGVTAWHGVGLRQ